MYFYQKIKIAYLTNCIIFRCVIVGEIIIAYTSKIINKKMTTRFYKRMVTFMELL